MTQTASKVARDVRSHLALLLCVSVLAAAVDSEYTTNDTLPRQAILSWAEDNSGDDPDATAYGDAAINEKSSVVHFENDSHMRTVRPEIRSATVAISVQTRAPPGYSAASAHMRLSLSSLRNPCSVAVVHVLGLFQPYLAIAWLSGQKPSCSCCLPPHPTARVTNFMTRNCPAFATPCLAAVERSTRVVECSHRSSA